MLRSCLTDWTPARWGWGFYVVAPPTTMRQFLDDIILAEEGCSNMTESVGANGGLAGVREGSVCVEEERRVELVAATRRRQRDPTAAITFSIFPNFVCANETPAGPRGVISNTAQRLVLVHLEQKEGRAVDTEERQADCRYDVAWRVGGSLKTALSGIKKTLTTTYRNIAQ